jgi:hypothetical protein
MYILSLDLHVPMFKRTLSEWDDNQKNLVHWLKFYNSYVFSVDPEDRPAERIIKYNALLDDWVEKKEYREKQERKKNSRGSSNVTEETFHMR